MLTKFKALREAKAAHIRIGQELALMQPCTKAMRPMKEKALHRREALRNFYNREKYLFMMCL